MTAQPTDVVATARDQAMVVVRPITESITGDVGIAMNKFDGLSKLVYLTDKSPQEKRKRQRRLVKGLSAGGPTRSTKEGNNLFPVTDREIIFTPVFKTMISVECCKLIVVCSQKLLVMALLSISFFQAMWRR